MSIYTVERAELLTAQLTRFHHGRAHHLAGQFANLEFWMAEVENALATLDGHTSRFERLRDAQAEWVESHNTQVPVHGFFCGICRGKCEFDDGKTQTPPPPKRLATTEKTDARRALVDATYHLLTRFFRMGLLDEAEVRANCDRIGTSIDPADLQRG